MTTAWKVPVMTVQPVKTMPIPQFKAGMTAAQKTQAIVLGTGIVMAAAMVGIVVTRRRRPAVAEW